ncbi:prepilin-type N-terminal cleavage/methylation domain-containing protein [Candidatus Microgenomates bacterium]|nr:MAG: prepilin-type N-terminal cleavage/methylation domain-containing protein [Candidatus Microgenomates bacterium]
MKQYTAQSAFTLVEVIVATFIFAVIAGLVAIFAVYYFQSYTFSFEENQAIGAAQSSLTRMVREIREIRSGDDGAYPIVDPQDTSFTFFADVTNDGRSDRVRYFLNGTTLQKGIIEPTSVPVTYPTSNETITTIAENVDNAGQALFTYYNGDWPSDTVNNPLSQSERLLNARMVEIYIRINVSQDFSSEPFELTQSVQIRSLKNNL